MIVFNLKGGYIFNYLWTADYVKTGQYSGSYAKRYWLGSSPVAGVGIEHKINRNLNLSCSFNYIFNQFDAIDPYLFSQDVYGIAIEHRVVYFLLGVKKQL